MKKKNDKPGSGFAVMDPDRHKEVSAKGGRNVPKNKRHFSNPEAARAAGSKPKRKK